LIGTQKTPTLLVMHFKHQDKKL